MILRGTDRLERTDMKKRYVAFCRETGAGTRMHVQGKWPLIIWRTVVKKWVAGRADAPEHVVEFLVSSTNCVLFWEGCCEEDSLDQGRGL